MVIIVVLMGMGLKDDVGDHNQDPHYKMFLENVKQDGKSYALAVHQEKMNHLPEVLRYETQPLVGGERGAENLEPMESSPVSSSIKGGRILRRLSNGENTEIADSLASFSSEGGVWSPRTLRYYAREKGKRENLTTSDAVPSKRRRIYSVGRNAGGESSIRYGLEDNCLIGHESCHEDDVDDVPSERRKSFLVRKRAGKELRGPKSGGTSLISRSKGRRLVENDFDHDNDGDDWGCRSEGNFSVQRGSDLKELMGPKSGGTSLRSCSKSKQFVENGFYHDNDDDDMYTQILNSGSRGACGSSYARLGSQGNFLDQRQSDHEDEIYRKDENDLAYLHPVECHTHHEGEIDDLDENRLGSEGNFLGQRVSDHEDDPDEEYARMLNSGSGGTSGGSYARLGSQGNFLDQRESDHEEGICRKDENDLTFLQSVERQTHSEDEIDDLNEYRLGSEGKFLDHSGPRGTNGDSYARLGSEGNFSDQLQSDHEDEICDKDENDLTYLHSIKCQTQHQDEIGDSDEYYGLVNCVLGGMNRQSNTRPCSGGSHSVKCACDQEDLYDDIDKEYVAFVNQLQLEGEDTAYEIDVSLRRFDQEDHSDDLDEEYVAFVNQLGMDGEDTIYKDDDSPWRLNKVESESDIEIMDEDPYGGGASTPFVSSNQCEQIDMGEIDVDNYSFAEDPAINCSKFKKGLMEVLKMPYDSKEHEALKHLVSYRSPIIQERDCGSTKKSYRREHKLGKSYLDLHTDFRKQLDEAENDDIKSLNLLRGFVYWLTNISYDMGFKPWLDPSCLEVLPQKLAGRTQHALKSECK